jgi:hypothetical protein
MSGGVIAIDGRGLNPNAIANFVENIKTDPFFEEPDLSSVTGVAVSIRTPSPTSWRTSRAIRSSRSPI